MVFAARLFINMTESVSELIAEYEEAKDRLQSIFTENDNVSDAAIRALDSKVSAAFKRLITAKVVNQKEAVDRIRYYLKQTRIGMEDDGLTSAFLAAIENDLDVLIDRPEISSRQKGDHALANANSLVELCYTSKSRQPLSDGQLIALCKQAERNNRKRSITSVLVYDENTETFMQVLEGARENVRQLMNSLLRDERHEQICIRFEGKIETRLFKEYPLLLGKMLGSEKDLAKQLEQDDWLKNIQKKSQSLNKNYSYDWLVGVIASANNKG